MLTSYRSLAFKLCSRTSFQASLHSGSRIAPVGISALFASVGSQPRLSYVAYRQLRLWSCSTQAPRLHSGSRIRYGLRALRQAPRLPLSHFAHQSALLDYCGLATLNGLARNGRSLRSTPRKIRSSSLAKLTLSSLDLRIPFHRGRQKRLTHHNQRTVLVLLRLKTGQKLGISLLYQHLLEMVCD